MLERELKAMVLNHLLSKGKIREDVIVINELTIDSFSRRADLAIIIDGKFIAFEVKSEADTLRRLHGQTEKYLDYFDKVVIVAACKHAEKVAESIPGDVEIWEALNERVKIKKRGRYRRVSRKANYLDFLKKSEMLLLSRHLRINCHGKSKRDIKELIGDNLSKMSFEEVKSFTLGAIRNRFAMTSSLFCSCVIQNGMVAPEDLNLLSPYYFRRQKNKASKDSSNSILKFLVEEHEEDPFLARLARESTPHIFGEVPSSIRKIIKG